MKPLLSVLVPAYNGEPFLDLSIHSLINERMFEEDLVYLYEIIIINDGSTDKTKEKAIKIGKRWNKQVRKDFIRVINKPNGQYGSVINRGLKEANGTYFKVLDCDDTFNVSSFIKTLFALSSIEEKVDVIFTDHTFEKIGKNVKIINSLSKYFEPYKILDFKKQSLPNDLMTMHSYIYRTNFLRDQSYHQIEGVYYSDSQYALLPLAKAETMYYIDLPLYRYYIGRHEQSINLKVMIKNKAHQLAVFETLFKETKLGKIKSKYVRDYTIIVLRRMIQWQAMLIAFDKNIKHKSKALMELLNRVKELQPKYYNKIFKGTFFFAVRLTRGKLIAPIMKVGIKLYQKFKKNIMAEWD